MIAHIVYSIIPASRSGTNGLRYIEYGVTASLMTVIIASLSGVRDLTSVAGLVVMTCILMGLGSSVERSMAASHKAGKPFKGWFSFPVISSWALFLAIWGTIIYTFLTVTSTVDGTPDWLPAIVFTEFALFAVFGVILMLYGGGSSFAVTEKRFIGASFASTEFLRSTSFALS